MPKAAKRFASQRIRSTNLSNNPETVRFHEFAQSHVGFDAEEHRIKTKYRTHLAHSKKVLKGSSKYITASSLERDRMEGECIKKLEDDKLKELEMAAEEWLKIVQGNGLMQDGGDMERDGDCEVDEDEIVENEEWNSGYDDQWETDDDDDLEEGVEDGSEFEDSIVDVSDNEILYDKDGNVIGEEDLAKGWKDIMEYHMNNLKRRLEVLGALARTEDAVEDEEDEETKTELE